MIEIVFSESACGSLRAAQNYGRGPYHGSACAVFFSTTDGAAPTPEEQQAAQRRAEEEARRAWESAVPLEIRHEDVYCFDLALSTGELSGNRLEPQDSAALTALLERYRTGEALRIWYSHQPDELCGLCWLMAQLKTVGSRAAVSLVRLPEWEYGAEGTVVTRNDWGEAEPSAWGRALSRQEPVPPALLAACAGRWRQLQEENAPLRISLNGQLQSAPADLYDSFLLRELAAQPEQFPMAALIGTVLGKYQLGISDGWLALRIEKLIRAGVLEIVQEAPQGALSYARILRKERKATLETM